MPATVESRLTLTQPEVEDIIQRLNLGKYDRAILKAVAAGYTDTRSIIKVTGIGTAGECLKFLWDRGLVGPNGLNLRAVIEEAISRSQRPNQPSARSSYQTSQVEDGNYKAVLESFEPCNNTLTEAPKLKVNWSVNGQEARFRVCQWTTKAEFDALFQDPDPVGTEALLSLKRKPNGYFGVTAVSLV